MLRLADEARITGAGGLADAEDTRLTGEAALTADAGAGQRRRGGHGLRRRAAGTHEEPGGQEGDEAVTGAHGERDAHRGHDDSDFGAMIIPDSIDIKFA